MHDGLNADAPYRYETMTSAQAKAALTAKPLAWLPVGCLEKHGDHLPMGLDPIKAHRICLAGARRFGGVVFPAHYYSGVHRFPNTPEGEMHARNWGDLYTYDTAELHLHEIIVQIAKIGARTMVLFSGHHPMAQMNMLARIAAAFAPGGAQAAAGIRVIPADERALLGEGDHAGIGETSLLLHLAPQWVDMTRIDDHNRAEHRWTDSTDARRATAAIGAARLAAILDALAPGIQTALAD